MNVPGNNTILESTVVFPEALRAAVVLSVLALLLSACAPARETLPLDTRTTPVERLLNEVHGRDAQITSLEGHGSIAFESPRLNGSFFFSVVLRRPDSVCVRFEGPFGMDAGFLFASNSRYLLYNAMENWYMTGSTGTAPLRTVVPLDLTFEQLLDAFAGSFRLPEGRVPCRYTADGDQFLLVFPEGADTSSFWIDPEHGAVTQYRVQHADSVLIEGTTDNWTDDDGEAMPRRITVVFPSLESSVSVFYSSLTMNPDSVRFSYAVPPHARRRVLQ